MDGGSERMDGGVRDWMEGSENGWRVEKLDGGLREWTEG